MDHFEGDRAFHQAMVSPIHRSHAPSANFLEYLGAGMVAQGSRKLDGDRCAKKFLRRNCASLKQDDQVVWLNRFQKGAAQPALNKMRLDAVDGFIVEQSGREGGQRFFCWVSQCISLGHGCLLGKAPPRSAAERLYLESASAQRI